MHSPVLTWQNVGLRPQRIQNGAPLTWSGGPNSSNTRASESPRWSLPGSDALNPTAINTAERRTNPATETVTTRFISSAYRGPNIAIEPKAVQGLLQEILQGQFFLLASQSYFTQAGRAKSRPKSRPKSRFRQRPGSRPVSNQINPLRLLRSTPSFLVRRKRYPRHGPRVTDLVVKVPGSVSSA
jgi:hypothetical protein